MGAKLDVLLDCHSRKQRDVLEGARDAEGGARVGGAREQILPLEKRRSAVGRIEAGNHVEQACLAGAIRTDDCGHFVRGNREGNVRKRL
jgi:hypothetical protein